MKAPQSAGHRASFATGRLKAGEQNKDEARYDRYLAERMLAGDVLWYAFERVRLKLADGTTYVPDFAVMIADGTLEMHEVKGNWQDDARVKIKVAQSLFPFRFIAIKPVPASRGGGWQVEDFENAGAPLLPDMRLKADVPSPKKREKPTPQDDPPTVPLRRKTRKPPPDTPELFA